MSTSRAYVLILCGILLFATALRLWGITWALPNEEHFVTYHPDEGTILSKIMTMDISRGKLLPHFYNYGSLQLYLILFAGTLMGANGSLATMFLVGRLLTALMGIGTVWATAAAGTRLWGRKAGLLAAVILAIMPLHVQHSHWLTVDVPATFWAMLSLVWTTRLAQSGEPKPSRAALLAGVFAGFAAATKYNLLLVMLPLVVAAWLRPSGSRMRPLLIGIAGCAAAFLAGCPAVLLDSHKWLADVRYEAWHVSTQPGPTFSETGSGFVYHVTRNLAAGLGWPLLAFCLLSIVYALWRRQRGDGLLAAFAVPYYIVIGLAVVRYARYDIPLLPVLALWAGRMGVGVMFIPHQRTSTQRKWPRGWEWVWPVFPVVFSQAVFYAFFVVSAMGGPDPRDQAVAWFKTHASPSDKVGFAALPWFQAPPLSPALVLPFPTPLEARGEPEQLRRFVYYGREWDPAVLAAHPKYIVLSEFDYTDALRLGNPETRFFLDALNRDYNEAAVFDTRGALHVLRPSELPHDMLYPSPMIWVYERK